MDICSFSAVYAVDKGINRHFKLFSAHTAENNRSNLRIPIDTISNRTTIFQPRFSLSPMNNLIRYPATPQNVDPQILQPSPGFKSEAIKVLGAILLFIVTYILLFTAALGLAALCAAGGLALIVLKPMAVTIMLGIGLAGLGVMVVVFLIKFLFKRHKVDRSGMVEITAADHPQLFEFIQMLSKETRTSFPKRIYLSPDVNASVFYDSSFWSMFLPVRKNLLIGLGLVNVVNVSELKAVIAHEFGHFSQRSMKLGSYVYNMNHIIFNMLYDNQGYSNAIESWGNASGYFAIFARLTIYVVQGIQWVLQRVYSVMNTIYMGLSRQMEFHADAVAASVSGGNHLVTALRRLQVADITYNNVFQFYQENFEKGLKPDNLYPQHQETLRAFADLYDLRIDHGLPQVDAGSFAQFNKSRIVIKDQWASHPSTDDREKHLRSLNIETPIQHDSAWMLFNNTEQVQTKMTERIFSQVQYQTEVQLVNATLFRERYRENIQRYQLPAIYKGFFDDRAISKTDLRGIENRISTDAHALDEILTDEALALPHQIRGIRVDIETLDAIINGTLKVKSFDFDGRRLKRGDALNLRNELIKELEQAEQSLIDTDHRVIAWFLKQAQHTGSHETLRQKYSEFFITTDECANDQTCYESMRQSLMPLYEVMPTEQIYNAIDTLKLNEVNFQDRLKSLLDKAENLNFISEDQLNLAKEYLEKESVYFNSAGYNNHALERLNNCMFIFFRISTEKEFNAKLDLLKLQLELANMVERLSMRELS